MPHKVNTKVNAVEWYWKIKAINHTLYRNHIPRTFLMAMGCPCGIIAMSQMLPIKEKATVALAARMLENAVDYKFHLGNSSL